MTPQQLVLKIDRLHSMKTCGNCDHYFVNRCRETFAEKWKEIGSGTETQSRCKEFFPRMRADSTCRKWHPKPGMADFEELNAEIADEMARRFSPEL